MDIETALKKSLLAIPSINGGKLLERMLPTLRIPGEQVVVLDQGSTDETEDVCRKAGVVLRQLGRPHTYTEACNIGAEMARERGCEFVFVANNDITFTTDVMRELVGELLKDPKLGIVAPAQMIVDQAAGIRALAYRVFWDLSSLTFAHDFTPPTGNTQRLEADFCELTMVGVRMSVIDEIGFLDNDYGFYHEDADFGFRLRNAGYTCAYLPNSQIEHWHSSTFASQPSQRKLDYLEKNKRLFAQKYLGYGVAHRHHNSTEATSWNIINKNLHPYLKRYGLVNSSAPELIFSHPGARPFDYLYTVWETSALPEPWLTYRDHYKMVMAPSRWVTDVMKQMGFNHVHYVPHGIESDVFQPWGPSMRFLDGKTFLWFASNQHRKGLDVMIKAWQGFHRSRPGAKLILMGTKILESMSAPDNSRVWRNFRVAEYLSQGISVYESISAMDEEFLATIYRSVDFTVCSSRSEGFGFGVAESMACGTPSIFGNFGGTADFVIPGALTYDGLVSPADYADKGFGRIGNWWEPSVEELTAKLFEANDMDAQRYTELSEAGVRVVRTKFSWRESSLAVRRALIAENQERRPVAALDSLALARPTRTAGKNLLGSAQAARPMKAGPHVRWHGMLARGIRRGGFFATFFADRLEQAGWKYALSASSKHLVGPYFRARGQWIKGRMKGNQLGQPGALSAPTPIRLSKEPVEVREGVRFIGYVEGALGLGQSLRANMTAAETAGMEFAIYPFRKGIETRMLGPFMPHRYDFDHAYEVNVILVSCDQLPAVYSSVEPELLSQSYNILCPYWELPRAPEAWREYLTHIHEIWAPNAFIAKAFSHIFDGPIVVVPAAMDDTGSDHPSRAHYGLDEGRFYFMFSFDYFSSPARKNPLGVVKAFQEAFPRGDENVGLVIKSTGAPDHYREMKAVIAEAMERDPRIKLFDENMPRDEMLGLIHATDAYVSLHRAEGFGLGMAEALTFGRIVIGTDFSGNQDFLTEETGYPVPYRLRPLEPNEYHWSEGQSWAEPDHDAAVRIMRSVAANPAEGRRRGQAGQDRVLQRYSPVPVGEAMKERLDILFAERRKGKASIE
jgi:glycosyltransferase involved in cell wall biosynthesis